MVRMRAPKTFSYQRAERSLSATVRKKAMVIPSRGGISKMLCSTCTALMSGAPFAAVLTFKTASPAFRFSPEVKDCGRSAHSCCYQRHAPFGCTNERKGGKICKEGYGGASAYCVTDSATAGKLSAEGSLCCYLIFLAAQPGTKHADLRNSKYQQ